MLVVDNASGDVLAYVGGSGELSSAPHVDGVRAPRQAGSTLKPFLYALRARPRGCSTAASLLDDAPLESPVGGGPLPAARTTTSTSAAWCRVRTALAGSLNVPAVRALQLVGVDALRRRSCARSASRRSTQPGDFYGPSLALGSADVTLWELVDAYRTLANGGASSSAAAASTPRTRAAPAERARASSRRRPRFSSPTSSPIATSRSVTFGLESPLATRFWSAVKTGTSKDMRDNWCVGFSRRYTVGVWVGNFSGEPMRDVSGVTGAAPVWLGRDELAAPRRAERPPAPPPGVLARRDAFADAVEPPRAEWFLAGTEPPRPQPLAPDRRASSPRPTAAVIALDPDIPAARQRLAFEARAASARLALAPRRQRSRARHRAPFSGSPRADGTRWTLSTATGACSHGVLRGARQRRPGAADMTGLDRRQTDRLVLTRMRASNFDALHTLHSNAKVMATLGGVRSRQETRTRPR